MAPAAIPAGPVSPATPPPPAAARECRPALRPGRPAPAGSAPRTADDRPRTTAADWLLPRPGAARPPAPPHRRDLPPEARGDPGPTRDSAPRRPAPAIHPFGEAWRDSAFAWAAR